MKASRHHWRPAYIGIGSNLDDPVAQVRRAFAALQGLQASTFARCSGLYRSAPMGPSDQPDFVNAVAALLTRSDPASLIQILKNIEDAHGRCRDTPRWGPRVIDLDLLVLGTLAIDAPPKLQIPHPGIAERNFVLFPLAEIAPHLVVPGRGSVQKLLSSLAEIGKSGSRIERLE
ncbi:MAG TPA: 2-amino-4-hydroxy-6-hydroxymethyldihydropteridine diphosphokinase [Woeseiaceae bacterium]|nr:2-amino-4-hydroxy-6-hydroxymethyldihydropteridine diphosphokinase [Woeseiaceae bacterium]